MNASSKSKLLSLCLAVSLAVLGGATLIAPRPASAQFACINCSTWVTQLLEYGRMIAQYLQQVEQYRKQLEQLKLQTDQYRNQLKHSVSLNTTFFDNALRTVRDAQTILRRSRAVTYAWQDLETNFRIQFPHMTQRYHEFHPGRRKTEWESFYEAAARSEETMSLALNSLEVAKRHATEMEWEQSAINAIAGQLTGAEGQMDVMQTVGELTQHSAQQMMKMRQIGMTQLNIMAHEAAARQRKEDLERAALKVWADEKPAPATRRSYTSRDYRRPRP